MTEPKKTSSEKKNVCGPEKKESSSEEINNYDSQPKSSPDNKERDPRAKEREKEPERSLLGNIRNVFRGILSGDYKHLTLKWFADAMLEELVRQNIDPVLIMKCMKEAENLTERLVGEYSAEKEKERKRKSYDGREKMEKETEKKTK